MVVVMGAYPLLNAVPVSALTGVMLVVVMHTFRWSSLPYIASAALPSEEVRALSDKDPDLQ
jgi:MFS superfamily sulfate permease-like transporter